MKIFQGFRHRLFGFSEAFNLRLTTQKKTMLMRINLTILALTILSLQLCLGSSFAQSVSINVKNAPIRTVFDTFKKQTGYQFFYDNDVLKKASNVTIQLRAVPLKEALETLFRGQPLNFEIVEKTIVVTEKVLRPDVQKETIKRDNISGKVTNEKGEPIGGVNVLVKENNLQTVTDKEGNFSINAQVGQILTFSYVGYSSREVRVTAVGNLSVVLSESVGELDQIQVIAYGTTTRRLNTGSVGTISAKDIANQPVSNPLAAMIGRVPGLVVTQQSGVPGSSFSIQIRGRNSIAQGSQPLILIDGIPFAAGNENMQLINSAINNFNQGSGVSPFNAINPTDIESIEILKDADATAIYGSRGANGVILLTTKKGKAGKTQINANFNQGFIEVPKLLPLLNTEQYIAMRKEAFLNAGTTPTASNAPDLLVFDQNRYTDFQKEFLGGTGHTTNANLSLSGGSETTQFLLSGTYYRETAVFPGSLPNQRGSMLSNISHKSKDGRFQVNFSGTYTAVENKAPTVDLTMYTFQSPNYPDFFDANGKLQWAYNGVVLDNPYSYWKEQYRIGTNNLAGSLNASYKVWKGLSAKILAGYNQQFTNEQKLSPAEAKSPSATVQGHSANIGKNQLNNWNIEPQLEYNAPVWKGKLTTLLGTTFLSRTTSTLTVDGSGYSSEDLMQSFGAATSILATSYSSLYRYQALFGRLNYNIEDKYIVNLTGRRDGSSRFGPGKQFANFGAVGAAWIFSSERWMKYVPVLSYGKLRGSYGVTGNDQIGDYQFVETWKPATNTYVGASGLVPNNLFNADYAWERNRKFEAALDLGFLKDRILLVAGYFQNRSGNQLINYRLPYITGFTSVIANFPAEVENKGWEFSLSANIFKSDHFHWESNFNITLPKNTLLSFSGIESSSYRTLYVVGSSLNSIYKYRATGVNPQTGLLQFEDINGSNSITTADYQLNGNTDPKFYGGWQNTISYKGLELQWFLDFKKQTGRNPYYYLYGSLLTAGTTMKNIPELLDSRWRQAGEITDLPKITAANAGTQASNTGNSSFAYSDQSFIRLRNVSLNYAVRHKLLPKIGAKSARVYLQAQNLLTFNRTKGYDPETQNLLLLPALQAYTVGVQISY